MRILITGAGGHVGHSLVDGLCNFHEIIGTFRSKKPIDCECDLLKCDLSCDEINGEYDVIIHGAAQLTGLTEGLVSNNIIATRKLVRYAEKTKVKRFVYLSTVAVFGEVDGILSENSNIVNPEIYGMTKYLCEQIVKESAIPEKLIIRLPKMLGPYIDLAVQNSGVIKMIRKLLKDEEVKCFIPNAIYNQWLCTDALANFIKIQLEKDAWKSYDYVNVAATQDLTMLQILEAMKRGMQSKSQIIAEDHNENPRCARVDVTKALSMGLVKRDEEKALEEFARGLKGARY